MILHGMTSNELGIVLLVAVSAMGMTAVPFAMAKAPNRSFWWTSLSFGLGLAILNYIMAVGAIGKISDHATSTAAQAISKAQSLKDQLEELRAARKELGAFKPTTQEMVTAADEAVRLAEDARRQECDKVGDFCRARVAQLSSRLSERAEIVGGLSLTKRAKELSDRTADINQQIQHLGSLPLYVNPQAERIKSIISWFYPPVATEMVANGIIHFLAIAAELFALGMPRILATALARSPAEIRKEDGQPDFGKAEPKLLEQVKPKALPATRLTPVVRSESVKDWKNDQLVRKPGGRLKCWDTFKAYEAWCKARNIAPSTFTAFDFELTALGVGKETGSRSFYLEVELAEGRSSFKVVA